MTNTSNVRTRAFSAYKLQFNEELNLAECLKIMFLTMDITRYNRCYFFSKKEAEGYSIRVAREAGAEIVQMAEASKQTPKLLENLRSHKIFVEENSIESVEVPIAMIAGGKGKGSKKAIQLAADAIEMASQEQMYESTYQFPKIPCKKCSTDAGWLAFCPSCGKQCRGLGVPAMVFLIFMAIVNAMGLLNIFSNMAYVYNISGELSSTFIQICVFDGAKILLYYIGTFLMFKMNKTGYWLFMAIRTVDVGILFYTLTSTSDMGIFYNIAITLSLMFLQYIVTSKDLDYMK